MTAKASARRTALTAFALTLVVLLANGRAIGSGDTNAVERTATALVEEGTVVLPDPGAAAVDPFTRLTPQGRVSIYPALPAALATPIFYAFRVFFDLDFFGTQIAGKLAAACLSALATALLAFTFARRRSPSHALVAALLFGLGTSVYSTSQALWQHPAAVLFLVIALMAVEAIDKAAAGATSPRLAAIVAAGALTLSAACRPAMIPMVAWLLFRLVRRLKTRVLWPLAVAAIPALGVAVYNATFFGAPWRFGPATSGRFFAALPGSIAGLLISPARGLLVFTPIAVIAFAALARRGSSSWLARTLLGAVAIHFAFIACWNEWHGGESFGPRLLTDLLPALFFFLPEGLAWRPRIAAVLGLLSVAVQLIGGWTYDYRWERLHQRGADFGGALWSWRDAPVPFALREGVVAQGRPVIDERRLRLRVQRYVPFGAEGSLIEAAGGALRISGSPMVNHIRLERGARIDGHGITLTHRADAVAFRALEGGPRGLRVAGTLHGTLRIESGDATLSTPIDGSFDFKLPLDLVAGEDVYLRAAAGDLRLTRIGIEPPRY